MNDLPKVLDPYIVDITTSLWSYLTGQDLAPRLHLEGRLRNGVSSEQVMPPANAVWGEHITELRGRNTGENIKL